MSTELISRTLTAGYYVIGIRSLTRFGTDFLRPHRTSALPPYKIRPRGASNAFRGEPASSRFDWHFTPKHSSSTDFSTSVGFGPLRIVTRASSWPCLDHLGSGLPHVIMYALIRLAFAVASGVNPLTNYIRQLAGSFFNRHTVTLSNSAPIACKHTVSCSISLPSPGFFSPFPRGTCSLSVASQYLALPDGPADSYRVSRAPYYLGYSSVNSDFAYRTATVYGVSSKHFGYLCSILNGVPQPLRDFRQTGLGCSAFTSPLLTESLFCFIFLSVLRCFSSRAYLARPYLFRSASPRFNSRRGCPIRRPHGSQPVTAPRGFSQFTASFIGCLRQGIHRALL